MPCSREQVGHCVGDLRWSPCITLWHLTTLPWPEFAAIWFGESTTGQPCCKFFFSSSYYFTTDAALLPRLRKSLMGTPAPTSTWTAGENQEPYPCQPFFVVVVIGFTVQEPCYAGWDGQLAKGKILCRCSDITVTAVCRQGGPGGVGVLRRVIFVAFLCLFWKLLSVSLKNGTRDIGGLVDHLQSIKLNQSTKFWFCQVLEMLMDCRSTCNQSNYVNQSNQSNVDFVRCLRCWWIAGPPSINQTKSINK